MMETKTGRRKRQIWRRKIDVILTPTPTEFGLDWWKRFNVDLTPIPAEFGIDWRKGFEVHLTPSPAEFGVVWIILEEEK